MTKSPLVFVISNLNCSGMCLQTPPLPPPKHKRPQRHRHKTATIVSMHTESYLHHGHTVYEHRLDVPLDHLRPAGEDNPTIQVFAREVVRKGRFTRVARATRARVSARLPADG